jgi:hypothetical protein
MDDMEMNAPPSRRSWGSAALRALHLTEEVDLQDAGELFEVASSNPATSRTPGHMHPGVEPAGGPDRADAAATTRTA